MVGRVGRVCDQNLDNSRRGEAMDSGPFVPVLPPPKGHSVPADPEGKCPQTYLPVDEIDRENGFGPFAGGTPQPPTL